MSYIQDHERYENFEYSVSLKTYGMEVYLGQNCLYYVC